jgi:hypothetical protein
MMGPRQRHSNCNKQCWALESSSAKCPRLSQGIAILLQPDAAALEAMQKLLDGVPYLEAGYRAHIVARVGWILI